MQNALTRAKALGQSSWYDNISRALLSSGEMKSLIDIGISGVTSNPTIFEKAITMSADYDSAISKSAKRSIEADEIFEDLAIQDIRDTADLLKSVYQGSNRVDGYACLEVSPHLAHDTPGTIRAAERIFTTLDRPNVMIKVPATEEGIPAIRSLISKGINVNVTLIFSLEMHQKVIDAYLSGLEDLAAKHKDLSTISSVASFFVSRVDTAIDKILESLISEGKSEVTHLLGKAAIANARKAYSQFIEAFNSNRFAILSQMGALVQRPLWASTSTKNPNYPDTLYVDSLLGKHTVNTLPPATLIAILDHGHQKPMLEEPVGQANAILANLSANGIDMGHITLKLLHEGLDSFTNSYDAVASAIKAKSTQLVTGYAR